MLKIGIFSKLSRISVRMLRYYDEAGLLAPGEVDPSTGYRYYHERQLMEAGRIRALRGMGFWGGAANLSGGFFYPPCFSPGPGRLPRGTAGAFAKFLCLSHGYPPRHNLYQARS